MHNMCYHMARSCWAVSEAGHSVATLCHLGNIARRLGRPLKWDSQKEIFPGDDEANQYVDVPKRKQYQLPTEV